MKNLQLSKNFWLNEFIRSQTATRLGIDNTPPPDVIDNLKLLCANILQPFRDAIGHPIFISSGYRCPELNAEIGGSKTSDHRFGLAADIDSANNNVFYYNHLRDKFKNVFDQLIWEFGDDNYPAWVHVSYNPARMRGEILRAYPGGKYVKI